MEPIILNRNDVESLMPGGDLKGSIINWYIKVIRNVFLPEKTRESTYFFSEFMISKLIGSTLEEVTALDDEISLTKKC